MKRFLRSMVLFLLCMALGLGVVFSGVTQAQITVSDPIIDGTTGGNFVGTYGECFFLLANPHFDQCEEELGPAPYSNIPASYNSPSNRNGCFDSNDPNVPVSDHGGPTNVCFGNPTEPLNKLPVEFDGFRVDDFSVYRVDNPPDQAVINFMDPDIAFAWSTIAGPNGGQYASIPCAKNLPLDTDRFTTFDSEFVEDTAVTEIEINQTGSMTLAYYFVNAAEVCRVLSFELFIGNEALPRESGTIGDFQSGKYLIFDVGGLTGAATIRLETTLISDPVGTPTTCGGAAPIPGVNAHISGVFISDCEPCRLEVTKMAEPDSVVCDSGTDGVFPPGRDDCVVACKDTGTDGDFSDDTECIAETVNYTITVTNPSNSTIRNIVVDDGQLGFMSDPFELAPAGQFGDSKTFQLNRVCLEDERPGDVFENTVVATVDGEICGEATATVTIDTYCVDTGTDGH